MVTLIFFIYCCFMSVLLFHLRKKQNLPGNTESVEAATVVIAFRNEKSNLDAIFTCLEKQQLAPSQFELVFVDDHSTDGGKEILEKRIKNSMLDAKVYSLQGKTGKKSAIELGVSRANQAKIVTLDADCKVGENWLSSMMHALSENVSMVLGPVKLEGNNHFIHQLQCIEFASLMGITLSTANWGRPILSNGANCAFFKQAFLQARPYSGNKQVATGDDIFLLHQLKKDKASKIVFCNHASALVTTATKTTVSSFLSQRMRWASKSKHYKDFDTIWMGVILFLINFCLLYLLFHAFWSGGSFVKLMYAFLLKWVVDLIFIQQIPNWLRPKKIITLSFVLSIVYPFYAVGIALLSLFYRPKWKGRKMS